MSMIIDDEDNIEIENNIIKDIYNYDEDLNDDEITIKEAAFIKGYKKAV